MKEPIELTKAEEQIMKQVWKLEKATIKEIVAKLPCPKPAYNTVATVLKVLKNKHFVELEACNNAYRYFPVVSERAYRDFVFTKLFKGYFSGSYHSLLSYLVEEKELDKETQERLKCLAEQLKDS